MTVASAAAVENDGAALVQEEEILQDVTLANDVPVSDPPSPKGKNLRKHDGKGRGSDVSNQENGFYKEYGSLPCLFSY